jgi:hypothetical protein
LDRDLGLGLGRFSSTWEQSKAASKPQFFTATFVSKSRSKSKIVFGRRLDYTALGGGTGAHNLELRAFNGSIAGPPASPVNLKNRGERVLAWNIRVINDYPPWVADHDFRKEVFGATQEPPRIP